MKTEKRDHRERERESRPWERREKEAGEKRGKRKGGGKRKKKKSNPVRPFSDWNLQQKRKLIRGMLHIYFSLSILSFKIDVTLKITIEFMIDHY
jgi:hypothetical protein